MPNATTPQIPFQNVAKGTSSTDYVDKLIVFLETFLPHFPVEKRLSKTMNENDLTEELYKYLTRKARINSEPFEFQPEKAQKMPKGQPKRTDLATRVNTLDIDMEVVYCLEAKKLPTDKTGKPREKEYALGEKGGIERFKNEAHGKNDAGNLLPRNGMIAYVFDQDFDHWHSQINQWISSTGWPPTEQLDKKYFKTIAKLVSNHARVSGSSVELTHFWVKI